MPWPVLYRSLLSLFSLLNHKLENSYFDLLYT